MWLLVFTEDSWSFEFCEIMSGKTLDWFQLVAVLKKFILKTNYLVFIDFTKIRADFSLLLKYLSLCPIKPQINLYVWTALSAIANVIWWIMGRCKNGET